MSTIGLPSGNDMHRVINSIDDNGINDIKQIPVGVAPAVGTALLVEDASTLINASGTDLAGRTLLRIHNPSEDVQVRIGPSSSDTIYKDGIPIEPGETKEIQFSTSQAIYGRSMGASVEVEVFEA